VTDYLVNPALFTHILTVNFKTFLLTVTPSAYYKTFVSTGVDTAILKTAIPKDRRHHWRQVATGGGAVITLTLTLTLTLGSGVSE